MNHADDLSAWQPRYETWLERARPSLEAAQWGDAFRGYPWVQFEETPFAQLGKPLSQARLGLLSTAGFYLKGQQTPFQAEHSEGDASFRVLPEGVQPERLAIAHTHYPHDAALADWNTVLPLDHLRALVRAGRLGGLGPVFSVSGYCTDAAALAERSAEPIAAEALAAGCDAMLLVPV